MSAPASCALCHPPPLDQPLQQGLGRKGWASGFPLPLHRENVQGWISDVCCGHSREEGALRATHVLPGAYQLLWDTSGHDGQTLGGTEDTWVKTCPLGRGHPVISLMEQTISVTLGRDSVLNWTVAWVYFRSIPSNIHTHPQTTGRKCLKTERFQWDLCNRTQRKVRGSCWAWRIENSEKSHQEAHPDDASPLGFRTVSLLLERQGSSVSTCSFWWLLQGCRFQHSVSSKGGLSNVGF